MADTAAPAFGSRGAVQILCDPFGFWTQASTTRVAVGQHEHSARLLKRVSHRFVPGIE
jgi:hypothetical protein